MTQAALEHVNITVADPEATARWLREVFGWQVRWSGDAIHGGRSIHVGGDGSYLAIYNPGRAQPGTDDSYHSIGGMNHIGVTIDDLDATEARVKAQGFKTYSHADYEPGRRFYFEDHDGIEFEVASYA